MKIGKILQISKKLRSLSWQSSPELPDQSLSTAEKNELPLATTYIIQPSGEISYAFLDVDYRNRAEPAELLEALRD